MAEWGTSGAGQAFESVGAVPAASTGTDVTAHATINTKGTWVELVAATARDASAVLVELQNVAAIAALIDIGIGGAGSETILIADLICYRRATGGVAYLFPVAIPAGTRIAARSQANFTAAVTRVKALLIGRGFEAPPALGKVTTYGATAADSGGITVDPGGVAHTDGAWAEIAATVSPMRWAIISITEVAAAFGISASSLWLLDIGIGGAGSEVVLIDDLMVSGNSEGDVHYPNPILLPLHIPEGTRLAARCRSNITSATPRRLDIIVYGVA